MGAQVNSSIPSLYGPGAVICWICTIISVLVSWACNNRSRFHDTITTDLMAALSLPLIATIQFLHELDKSGGKDWIEPGIRDATFTICGIYTWVSPVLLLLGAYLEGFRRTAAVGLVGVLCSTVNLTALARTHVQSDGTRDIRESKAWMIILSLVPLVLNITITVIVLITRPRPKTTQDWKIPRSRTAKQLCKNVIIITAASIITGYVGWISRWYKKADFPFMPSTPYPIGDLDQAVALTAGILTVLISTIDAFSSRGLSEWEVFEDWRQRSRLFLDAKIIGDEEAAKWKGEMDTVDGKVKEMLKLEVRVNLEKLMKEHADRIKKEEEAKARNTSSSSMIM
jgi:hypothetical protein